MWEAYFRIIKYITTLSAIVFFDKISMKNIIAYVFFFISLITSFILFIILICLLKNAIEFYDWKMLFIRNMNYRYVPERELLGAVTPLDQFHPSVFLDQGNEESTIFYDRPWDPPQKYKKFTRFEKLILKIKGKIIVLWETYFQKRSPSFSDRIVLTVEHEWESKNSRIGNNCSPWFMEMIYKKDPTGLTPLEKEYWLSPESKERMLEVDPKWVKYQDAWDNIEKNPRAFSEYHKYLKIPNTRKLRPHKTMFFRDVGVENIYSELHSVMSNLTVEEYLNKRARNMHLFFGYAYDKYKVCHFDPPTYFVKITDPVKMVQFETFVTSELDNILLENMHIPYNITGSHVKEILSRPLTIIDDSQGFWARVMGFTFFRTAHPSQKFAWQLQAQGMSFDDVQRYFQENPDALEGKVNHRKLEVKFIPSYPSDDIEHFAADKPGLPPIALDFDFHNPKDYTDAEFKADPEVWYKACCKPFINETSPDMVRYYICFHDRLLDKGGISRPRLSYYAPQFLYDKFLEYQKAEAEAEIPSSKWKVW